MEVFAYKKEAQDKYGQKSFEPFIKVPKEKQFALDAKSDGDYEVRLMPPWSSEGIFAKGTIIHYFVGAEKQIVICPNTLGPNLCPFCRVHSEIKSDKMYLADTEAIRPNWRYYSNVVDMKNPGRGVLLWSYGPQIFFPIKKVQDSGRWGDVTNPLEGYDFLISRQVRGKVTDAVNPAPQPSHLLDDRWLDQRFNIDEVVPEADEALVKSLFASHPWKVYEPRAERSTQALKEVFPPAAAKSPQEVNGTSDDTVAPEKHVQQANDVAARLRAKLANKAV